MLAKISMYATMKCKWKCSDMDDKKLDHYKQEILTEIKMLGYEPLRYAVLEKGYLGEFQVRIDYDGISDIYEVYTTMDRGSKLGSYTFKDFYEAKNMFFALLKMAVSANRAAVRRGDFPEYPCELWEDVE